MPSLEELRSRHIAPGTPAGEDIVPFLDVTEAGNSPIKKTTLTEAVAAGLAGDPAGAWDVLAPGADVQGDATDAINNQPFSVKKVSTWTLGASPPLRQMVVGDSLSVFGGLIRPGPNMGRAGVIGLQTVNGSGTFTNHTGPSGSFRPDIWISGTGTTFQVGSSAEFTEGGRANGDVRGDRACIAYIAGPGKGSFDLQYQVNATGAWTPVGIGTARNFTVDAGTDVFTAAAHGFTQNQGVWVSNSGGSLPTASGGDLAASTNYFVIYIDANTFKLARTLALAQAGTAIDITGAGTGTHTATPYSGIGINTANASTIGVFQTYNLPTTNLPFYRLRITNVTVAAVDICPLVGIYNSTGGGVIEIRGGSSGGLDIATHLPQTPAAVFDPVWTALAPDYVINVWADAAAEWNPGGSFDTFYNRATAAFASTDWILVSRNPSSEPEGIPYSVAVARAQAQAQRSWALTNRHTFINGHEMFGGSWTVSNARGLAADTVHPSVAGAANRNLLLWQKIPLGNLYLGGGFQTLHGDPLMNQAATPATIAQPARFGVALETTQLRLPDSGAPMEGSRVAYIQKDTSGSSRRLAFFGDAGSLGGYFDFGSGLIGFYAGGDNWALGAAAARWNGFFAGISARQRTETAATVTVIATDHTVFCNATSNAITVNLPQASANSGRILAFVKTDASGNAVTIDPSGAETVNGAATLALTTQWQSCQIQSNGTNWIRIA